MTQLNTPFRQSATALPYLASAAPFLQHFGNGFPDRIEVIWWYVLRPDAELLELANRGEDLLADGWDMCQAPLVRGRHEEGLYFGDRL